MYKTQFGYIHVGKLIKEITLKLNNIGGILGLKPHKLSDKDGFIYSNSTNKSKVLH